MVTVHTFKVVYFEDGCSALGRSPLKLGRMDLDKAFRLERLAEQVGYSRLEDEDALRRLCL